MTPPAPEAGTIDRFVVVPASYVYLLRPGERGDEVLLQLRRHTDYMDGHWAAAAAGHVERGETAYDAAVREAVEEIDVSDLALRFVTSMQRTQGGEPIDERIDFFFTARSWSGTPRIVEPAKCGGLEWFPLADLPDPVVPHELEVLRGIAGGGLAPYTTFGFSPAHPGGGCGPAGGPPTVDTMTDTEPQDVRESNPNSSGPQRAEGGMGVSSERTGHTGPGQHTSDGIKDTSLAPGPEAEAENDPDERGDVAPEQRPGAVEENSEASGPKAGYPSLDPRSD